MGIKIDITAETPLSDDDRDILAGISVMILAIANRQNLTDPGEEPEGERPCGLQDPDDEELYCISPVGHPGRHKYRPWPTTGGMN